MSARLDAETKRLRALSLAQLADEIGAAKSQTEAIKAGSDPPRLLRAESLNWEPQFSLFPGTGSPLSRTPGMEPPTAQG